MTNLLTARTINVKVSTNSVSGVIDSRVPVTLKNNPVLSGGGSVRLDHLQDVVSTGETDGATLVYEAATDKYIVKKLDLADVIGDLDGGTF